MTEKKPCVRVLIAEDEPHIRKLLHSLMTSMNTEVVGMASNGNDAVAMFKKHEPNIVIMDINMPYKNGVDALREIYTEFSDTLIIMLTSVSDPETIKQCFAYGAHSYILKDTNINEIGKRIHEAWVKHCQPAA